MVIDIYELMEVIYEAKREKRPGVLVYADIDRGGEEWLKKNNYFFRKHADLIAIAWKEDDLPSIQEMEESIEYAKEILNSIIEQLNLS